MAWRIRDCRKRVTKRLGKHCYIHIYRERNIDPLYLVEMVFLLSGITPSTQRSTLSSWRPAPGESCWPGPIHGFCPRRRRLALVQGRCVMSTIPTCPWPSLHHFGDTLRKTTQVVLFPLFPVVLRSGLCLLLCLPCLPGSSSQLLPCILQRQAFKQCRFAL